MRTNDFSKAPKSAQSEAMFFGATRYRVRGLFGLPYRWLRLYRVLKKAPGFTKLVLWYEFPLTIGSVAFFETEEDLMLFARTEPHRKVMKWVGDPKESTADAGFIRVFSVHPTGYANGRWSVENKMDHIKTFTYVKGDAQPEDV